MAHAWIFIISIIITYKFPAILPVVRIFFMIIHDHSDNLCIIAVFRNITESFFQYFVHIRFHKCIANAHSHKNTSMDSVSAMSNTCCFPCKFCRYIRIPRCNQSPGINKNLTTNLFCSCFSILFNASAFRSFDSISQIQICCMFC